MTRLIPPLQVVICLCRRCSDGRWSEETVREREDRHALQGCALSKEAGRRENMEERVLQLPLPSFCDRFQRALEWTTVPLDLLFSFASNDTGCDGDNLCIQRSSDVELG
jgi:hypothetical protein